MEIPPRPGLPASAHAQTVTPLDSAIADLGLDRISTAVEVAQATPAPWWRRVATWVLLYGVIVAFIAFWPQPVDSGAGKWLGYLTRLVPILTYERIEFGSNILLFVPLGIGLGLLLSSQRHLVVPLAFLTSLIIETVQAILLPNRTPSVFDLVANVAGTCVGLVVVAAFEGLLRHRGPDYSGAAQTR